MITLIKSYIHVNLKYIICQIWEGERKKIGMITFKNVFSLGCKLQQAPKILLTEAQVKEDGKPLSCSE